ncbi:MAG: hypothetical protein U0518_03630 [Candidatus Gracilibacteria bacterium]
MFQGRIVSRSNINGKVHTFQKDFDDYDSYQKFINENPEYNTKGLFQNFFDGWNSPFDSFFALPGGTRTLPADIKHLPDGVDLTKYENRRAEKRRMSAEQAERRYSLEQSKTYIQDYLSENPDDSDAQDDLKKIEQELQKLT